MRMETKSYMPNLYKKKSGGKKAISNERRKCQGVFTLLE
jgi:hypothetical protein